MTPDSPFDFDLSEFTPYRLAVAAQKVSEELSQIYHKRFGLSIPEWRVMVHLTQGEDTSVRDIEAKVVLEKSKVSRTTDKLRDRGLLTKKTSNKDRRLLELELTDKGRALMMQLLPSAKAYQKDLENRLGDDFEGLQTALTRILEADR